MNTEHTNQSSQAEPAPHSTIDLQSIPERQRGFTAENIRDIAHECMRIGDNEQAEVIFAIADALRDGNLTIHPAAVAVPTIKLGLYGRAFDTPQTRRAYTYQHQPDNLDAYSLGRAAASTSPGGDNIDRGLSLLKELQAHGFGVFELGDQQEGGA